MAQRRLWVISWDATGMVKGGQARSMRFLGFLFMSAPTGELYILLVQRGVLAYLRFLSPQRQMDLRAQCTIGGERL